jgi:prepilin-type N-terminal cleavage/methylation domain-containing protein
MGRSAKSNMRCAARRRAFTLMELTVAISVMAILMITVAQWASASRRAETTIHERNVALEAAENVVQRIALIPESEWDAKPWGDWTLPEETRAALPGGVLSVTVEEETETSLRFQIVVSWDASSTGTPPLEASLTTWRFRASEEQADEAEPLTDVDPPADDVPEAESDSDPEDEMSEPMEGDSDEEN